MSLDSLSDRPSDSLSPAGTAEMQDLAEQARRLMHGLPEKQRLVMHLRDVEEMTYDEIAESLKIPLDQVKINLHRARKAIRNRLFEVSEFLGNPETGKPKNQVNL
jgi:RNA polymerase sigma-70 factor (ECF subfamily)